MTTAEALYRAILEVPGDDNRRLRYADAVQGQGDPVLAEFVRVQVKLAQTAPPDDGPVVPNQYSCERCWAVSDSKTFPRVPGKCPHCGFDKMRKLRVSDDGAEGWPALRRREEELWNRAILNRAWFSLPGGGFRPLPAAVSRFAILADGRSVATGEFARGFPDKLTCTAAVWLGGPCRRCDEFNERRRADPTVGNPGHRCPDCRQPLGASHVPALWESLYWSAADKRGLKCPECQGKKVVYTGRRADGDDQWTCADCGRASSMYGHRGQCPQEPCPRCAGEGTVSRPPPATALPLTRLTLTTEPTADQLCALDPRVRGLLVNGRPIRDIVLAGAFPGLAVTITVA